MTRPWQWVVMAAVAGVLLAWMAWTSPRPHVPPLGQTDPLVRARVTAVLETGTWQDESGRTRPVQRIELRLLEGEFAGVLLEAEYGRYQPIPEGFRLRAGDEVWVTVQRTPDGFLQAYVVDVVRVGRLGWLAALFVLATLLISGWKGLRSLLAMAYSLGVIVFYIIPRILAGQDPVWVSVTGAIVLLGVTLYFTYGLTWKTHAAVISMAAALLLTGGLAWFSVWFTRLTGTGAEEALFLVQLSGVQLNLRGLLLGGMIIGALGVLDDLVTTQAAAVFELYDANPTMPITTLIRRAMRIGQDHVAATVNTLVLAYAGTALPLLLLFTVGREPWTRLLNYEFMAEEVVRTLAGALGLIASIPLTTVVAAWLATRFGREGGASAAEGPHGHVHGL